jgi:isopenicillin-N N-acyltransferase like protein
MRVLELPAGGSPREWGRVHGETFRGEIGALAAIRVYLTTTAGRGRFADRAGVLAAAERHLPVLARWDAALHEELCGIAEGAGLTPAEIVVANHYTDLRDLPGEPAAWQLADGDGGCSLVWARTPEGAVLAQTWDMHATAIPYAMMLHVPESAAGPAAWLLSLTGCLGLAGMNAARTAIGINNLHSTDARIGVVWPALVRRALQQPDARAARDVVLAAPVGSGHHYLVGDRRAAYGIETSGTRRAVVFAAEGAGGPARFCHTNHALDPRIAPVTAIPEGSTSHDRLAWLEASLAGAPLGGLADAWRRLGSQENWPRSICTNQATPEHPHGSATCGAIAMNLDTGEVWAQGGLITHVRPEIFQP